MKDNNLNIAVIGLGYVGLPLAIEFGKKRNVVGFDINEKRIESLKQGKDSTLECSETEIKDAKYVSFTSTLDNLKECNCFIVTVPTPIDDKNIPDLKPLEKATEMIGAILKKEDLVIYESTVFPGATEEFCVPILEKKSSLEYKKDFSCGYSPERINPGDKNHRIKNIKKVTSGSSDEVANIVDNLYKEIIEAGTHKAESIKVAEAAKVIENTQRDLNIALINELSLIFNKMGIDTESVLDAAGSKWNFLPFKPGLVGGHCIGVDPYYLTYKAQEIGYNPEIILAGRKLNDYMSKYVSSVILKELSSRNIKYEKSSVLVMGMTFKENCPDTRNTKIKDLVDGLLSLECNIDIYDPWITTEAIKSKNVTLVDDIFNQTYQAIIVAVKHNHFTEMSKDNWLNLLKNKPIFFDLKKSCKYLKSDFSL